MSGLSINSSCGSLFTLQNEAGAKKCKIALAGTSAIGAVVAGLSLGHVIALSLPVTAAVGAVSLICYVAALCLGCSANKNKNVVSIQLSIPPVRLRDGQTQASNGPVSAIEENTVTFNPPMIQVQVNAPSLPVTAAAVDTVLSAQVTSQNPRSSMFYTIRNSRTNETFQYTPSQDKQCFVFKKLPGNAMSVSSLKHGLEVGAGDVIIIADNSFWATRPQAYIGKVVLQGNDLETSEIKKKLLNEYCQRQLNEPDNGNNTDVVLDMDASLTVVRM